MKPSCFRLSIELEVSACISVSGAEKEIKFKKKKSKRNFRNARIFILKVS